MADTKTSSAAVDLIVTEVAATGPSPASYSAIVAECVGADAAFICSQLEKKATIDESRKAWMAEQQLQLQAAQAKAVDPKGVVPVTSKDVVETETIDAIAEWNTEIEKLTARGLTHRKAASMVNRRNPDLREAMVVQYNEQHSRDR